MDREVIEQKLESLRRCLKRIAEKCPAESEKLINDLDLQDIIALNLSRAVQLCVDIGAHLIARMEVAPPDTMGQTFDIVASRPHATSSGVAAKKDCGVSQYCSA